MDIRQSDQLNELFGALCDLQGEVQNVYKDTKGYNYKYAEIDTVLKIVRPLFKKNGLVLMHNIQGISDNKAHLYSLLGHRESGQYVGKLIEVPLPDYAEEERIGMANYTAKVAFYGKATEAYKIKINNKAQDMGAAITYARRYDILSICGMAQTDDDAARLDTQEPTGNKVIMTQAKPVALPPSKPALKRSNEELSSMIEETGTELDKLLEHYKVKSLQDLSDTDYNDAYGKIKRRLIEVRKERGLTNV